MKQQTYENEDMQALIEEIEEFEDQKVTIRAEAAGKCGGIGKKIKEAKKRAKDLSIPSAILNGLLKQRRLERQLEKVSEDIPEDLAEVWEDAAGQFSFIAPAEEAKAEETSAQRAASKRAKQAKADQEAEQEEGAKVLDELSVH